MPPFSSDTREPDLPWRYRSLLVAHPRAWRERYGELVIGTLLDVHAASGRSRPGAGERVSFLVDGLRRRLRPPARRPAAGGWDVRLLSVHRFDQENGRFVERPLSESEQIRANLGDMVQTGDRSAAVRAWIGFTRPPRR